MENKTYEELVIHFHEALKETNRPGVSELLNYMLKYGFFESPCSGAYHLCKESGLLIHSLNVYEQMHIAAKSMLTADEYEEMKDSITIVSLLHDLGKMGDHGKPNYVKNMVRSKSKNKETGEYDMVQSTAKPYETNKDLAYIDHEIRSVVIAERFINLTEDEEFAILQHNGMYGNLKHALQGKETPLQMLLHFADMWSSKVIESEVEDEQQ